LGGGIYMKQIIIEIPETKEELKEFEKHIHEIDEGALNEINHIREIIDDEFSLGYKISLFFPMCCETCKFEGGAFWHCHNPKAPKCHINVSRYDVCSHYVPNWGLMTYLWYSAWLKKSEEDRAKNIKFMEKVESKNKKNANEKT